LEQKEQIRKEKERIIREQQQRIENK